MEPDSWADIDLALSISTEPYLLIDEGDRSPFNVGQPLVRAFFQKRSVMKPSNPPKIKAGGALNPLADLHVTRQDVEDEVFKYLLKREYCNILSSRQVGKSSLMINTKNHLIESGFRTGIIDFTQLSGDDSAEQSYIAFLRTVARGLKLTVNVVDWRANRARGPLNERLIQFIREEVCRADPSPVVIFCGEIDITLKLDFTDDFFTSVRAMYNSRIEEPLYKEIAFCMIGVAAPDELIKNPRTTPYNC